MISNHQVVGSNPTGETPYTGENEMKASVKQAKARKLIAVVTEDGKLVLETANSSIKDDGYPCHVIGKLNIVSLTSANLENWAKRHGSTPVYEGDTVTLEF